MFNDQGCFGRVEIGPLPEGLARRLAAVQGEWLEYDPPSGAIVVRHIEPTASLPLPVIAFELVRLFVEIPPEHHAGIPGGDLFVHTEEERGQLVRLRVEAGGGIRIEWAHPDFKRALRRPWSGGTEIAIDPEVQCLNGTVCFRAAQPREAAAQVQQLADTFEGLYPEGDFRAETVGKDGVEVRMKDVNLDASLLVALLLRVAEPRSLSGRFEMGSFGTVAPEHRLRFLFEGGKAWVQHPLLWSERSAPT
jgi:hypothetical protein